MGWLQVDKGRVLDRRSCGQRFDTLKLLEISDCAKKKKTIVNCLHLAMAAAAALVVSIRNGPTGTGRDHMDLHLQLPVGAHREQHVYNTGYEQVVTAQLKTAVFRTLQPLNSLFSKGLH